MKTPIEFEPASASELLRRYPPSRITGWDATNPPQVERAFRVGYAIGAARCACVDLEDAAAFEKRFHTRRGDIYYGELHRGFERWSDRRAALLRGATQGAIEMVRARAAGVRDGMYAWLKALHRWATENPIRLDWKQAAPPNYPDPDAAAMRCDEVPRRLRGEVYGLWAMFDSMKNAPACPPGESRQSAHPNAAIGHAPALPARKRSDQPPP